MDGALGRNKDIEGETGYGAGDTDIVLSGGADIIFMSQKMGGLQIGIGADLDDTDATLLMVQWTWLSTLYQLSPVSISYVRERNIWSGQLDESNFGVSTSIAGFNIGVGARNGLQAALRRLKPSDVGVNYTLGNGIKVAGYSASGNRNLCRVVLQLIPSIATLACQLPDCTWCKALNAESGKVAKALHYTWVAVNMSF